MKRLAVVVFSCACAFAQNKPAFQAADVHPSAAERSPQMRGGYVSGGQYRIRAATMADLIRTAYGVEAEQVVGGPGWLAWDRYDIRAIAPANTSAAALDRMLQSLLADRFKLVVHNETRPLPAWVLTQGKGKLKLKMAEGKGETGCQAPPPAPPSPGSIPQAALQCRNVGMAALAALIRDRAIGYVSGPVIDSTGLSGAWDFDLKFTPSGLQGLAGADAITIFQALDKQLGLKLEQGKIDAPAIVVDNVNENPAPNPPETARLLPPPPPQEFEVADIRPSPPDATPAPFGMRPGGRFEMRNVPLQLLIMLAYNILPSTEIVGAPKWLEPSSPNFDLLAKVTVMSGGTRYFQQIDDEDLRAMLKRLLEDRFHLKAHFENRQQEAYTLMADKPKMKKADPSERTGCFVDTPFPSSPGDGPPPVKMTCRNITMKQFAGQLQPIAPIYFRYPVEDATGLEGGYDFTLTYSLAAPGGGGGGGGRGGTKSGPAPVRVGDGASDPSGGVQLYDAISKQLGLKAEARKRPEPALVIDHIDQKPSDN